MYEIEVGKTGKKIKICKSCFEGEHLSRCYDHRQYGDPCLNSLYEYDKEGNQKYLGRCECPEREIKKST